MCKHMRACLYAPCCIRVHAWRPTKIAHVSCDLLTGLIVLSSPQEQQHVLVEQGKFLCPADQRVQNWINDYLHDVDIEPPKIPVRQLKLGVFVCACKVVIPCVCLFLDAPTHLFCGAQCNFYVHERAHAHGVA